MASISKKMTLEELKRHNGKGPDGKIYVALKGKIYDVTNKGEHFYGAGAPYETLAGRDASRALATMAMAVKDVYDDLADLSQQQRDSLNTWETQFQTKYETVGTLSH